MRDRKLVLDALLGNTGAFRDLLHCHESDLRRIADAIFLGRANAEDLQEEAFQRFSLRVLERGCRRLGLWHGLTDDDVASDGIGAFLGQIMRNVCRDLERELFKHLGSDGEVDLDEGMTGPLVAEIELDELRRVVRRCVDRLATATRAAMRTSLAGYSDVEAAEWLGIKHSTYRQRISVGRKRVAHCVERQFPGLEPFQ
jgi:DNA-directed RNA polymerase specialized sigma24 family protein